MKTGEGISKELEIDMDEVKELFSTDTLNSMRIATSMDDYSCRIIVKERFGYLNFEEICSIIDALLRG